MLESAWEILQIILPMLAVILIGFLFKLINTWTKLIDDQRTQAIVQMLVQAAEQEYGPMNDKEKYQYVLDGLNYLGIKVGAAAIEAAVFTMNRKEEIK